MPEEAIQYLKEIKELLQKQKEPKMLFVKDVAKILKVNLNKANELWDREDFPRDSYRPKKDRRKSI